MYDIALGKRAEWEHKLLQGLPERYKLCEPVGVWFTEFGPQNTGNLLNSGLIVRLNAWPFCHLKAMCVMEWNEVRLNTSSI